MKVTLTINCDSAAFEGDGCGPELRWIARNLLLLHGSLATADDIKRELDGSRIMDSNGNAVGEIVVK